ncbi:hypothetical protein MVEN_02317600 [Mycena venus]|uniref:F-box domain-containing protein n=1 Tax=Mycena venus TaxID=2733690 RepID=A0A8H6X4C5_9AGAR|nr:hypothetical protein MVEN_02317600 [Mycena venus]
MAGQHPRSLPQELQDSIVLLVNLTQDLRSCAFVSSSLLRVARSLLFRNIEVNHPRTNTNDPPTAAEDRAYTSMAFRRLGEVLISAPDVKGFIHSLTFAANLDVVILLADMNLSSLAELNILGNGVDALGGDLVEPLQRLIGIPSLRVIELNINFSPQIFRFCGSDLTDLMFEDAEVVIPVDIPKLPDDARRPAIAHLSLDNSSTTADWLIDPECPFTLTQLVSVVLVASLSDSARLVIVSSRRTITDLTLSAEDLISAPLDLAQFPALTQIQLCVSHICEMTHLLRSLSELDGGNIIQTITLELDPFDVDDLTPQVETNLIAFDSDFNKLPLPMLRQFLILLLPPPKLGHEDDTTEAFHRALPLLYRRFSGSSVWDVGD